MKTVALILFVLIVLMAFIFIPVQIRIVKDLNKKGIKAPFLTFLPNDIKSYKRLIDKETSESDKKRMRFNYYYWIVFNYFAFCCLIFAGTSLIK